MNRSSPQWGSNGPYILAIGEKGMLTELIRLLDGRYQFDATDCERDALEWVRDRPYHLVIATHISNDMNGLSVVSEGLEAGARFRTIFLVGDGSCHVGQGVDASMYECLESPFSPTRFLESIERAWYLLRLEASHLRLYDSKHRLRRRLKEELRERKQTACVLEMNEHALLHSINALFFTDSEGALVAVNPAFLQVWGYDKEEEVLGVCADHFFAMDRGFVQWHLQLVAKGGLHQDMMAVKKDGALFPVQASIRFFGQGPHLGQGYMGAFIDLTEKSRTEEFKLQSLKLLALGHLSAGLAHELRNPLAVISSCAQFSLENLNLERPLAENLQVIYRNSQKASRLIEELLSFAKPSNLDWKQVSINGLLDHVLQMAKLEAKRVSIRTFLETDPHLPKIIGDQGKLEQVFLNITLNAFQAVSKNGWIVLKTRFVETKKMVEVNVIDNGPGIPEEYRQQVFDPFFTTKDNGTGLGLSISHAIIKQHGGQIRINCEKKNETNISILLPIENPEQADIC